MKILVINGSPRQDGNIDVLLREVVAGINSQQVQAKTVFLRDMNICPCRQCHSCDKTGKCVIEDDMQELHKDLREADVVILGSPIFFLGVTAQSKTMIDRCQALWAIKYVLRLPVAFDPGKERRGFFVSVGGLKLANLFQPAIATVKSWFIVMDIKYQGQLTFPGIDEKGAIAHHPTALKEAFAIGQKLAANQPIGQA